MDALNAGSLFIPKHWFFKLLGRAAVRFIFILGLVFPGLEGGVDWGIDTPIFFTVRRFEQAVV